MKTAAGRSKRKDELVIQDHRPQNPGKPSSAITAEGWNEAEGIFTLHSVFPYGICAAND